MNNASHPRAFRALFSALVYAHASTAFGLTLEAPRGGLAPLFLAGAGAALVTVNLFNFVRGFEKVFLYCAAAVLCGTWAFAGASADLRALLALSSPVSQQVQVLATPLALWFATQLMKAALEARVFPKPAQQWLTIAGAANLFLAMSALWFSAVASAMPWCNVALVILAVSTGIYFGLARMARYRWTLTLTLVLACAGTLSAMAMTPGAYSGTVAQVLFTLAAAGVSFWLKDQQHSKAVKAYQTQFLQSESQSKALEKLKAAESALEAKVSQRTHELHLAVQRLETLSALDGLTGVANRRRFDEMLKVECGRAIRSRQKLSVALIDVDWFGRFNGRYGHERGDACLCKLARVLESGVMRSGDLIARYSGGAFVLLTPDTDSNGIFSIANYLCQEVYGLALAHDDSPLGRVSISVGVATACAKESMSPERLVQRAAAALASAKLRGHHCVVAA